jgi:hypothetical protein
MPKKEMKMKKLLLFLTFVVGITGIMALTLTLAANANTGETPQKNEWEKRRIWGQVNDLYSRRLKVSESYREIAKALRATAAIS